MKISSASLLCFAAFSSILLAEEKAIAPGKRIMAADDSKGVIAIIAADGTVEWEEKCHASHDAALLPNGNVLFQASWTRVVEMTPDKKIVWEYDAQKSHQGQKVEVHGFQALGDGKVMVAESGPSRIVEVDREGKVTSEIKMQVKNPNAHRDTRLVRKLKNGNYLAAHEGDGRVCEYSPKGEVVWDYDVPLFGKQPAGGHGPESWGNQVFSAIRLENGNTLIGTGNGHSVLEVTPKKEIVWQVGQKDLEGITLAWVCRVQRLENGNTVISNCHAGPENPQLVEVSPEKKVVWQWKDFAKFGNGTAIAMRLPEKESTPK